MNTATCNAILRVGVLCPESLILNWVFPILYNKSMAVLELISENNV